MYQLLGYHGKWQGFKGRLGQLPAWARFLVGVAALPGIVLLLLSIAAILVSLLALFLLTTPVFRLVCFFCGVKSENERVSDGFGPVPEGMDVIIDEQGGGEQSPQTTVVVEPVQDEPRTPRRQIDVKIVE